MTSYRFARIGKTRFSITKALTIVVCEQFPFKSAAQTSIAAVFSKAIRSMNLDFPAWHLWVENNYFKALPLPLAFFHTGSYNSVRPSAVNCKQWTSQTRYHVSCCDYWWTKANVPTLGAVMVCFIWNSENVVFQPSASTCFKNDDFQKKKQKTIKIIKSCKLCIFT